MKVLISSLILMTFTASLHAQAEISFSNSTIEFNHIKRGVDSTLTYTFKNTGNQPLIIKRVVSTSRHLSVSKPGKEVAPGKTGKIEAKFKASNPGPVRRTVTVYSNAKNNPVTALKIKGLIIE